VLRVAMYLEVNLLDMTRVMPKTGMSKRRWPDKNTEEYSEKRAQNNVAVK